jgi:hypothetical protein
VTRSPGSGPLQQRNNKTKARRATRQPHRAELQRKQLHNLQHDGTSGDSQDRCSARPSRPPIEQTECQTPIHTSDAGTSAENRTEQRCYKGLGKQLRCNGTPYREATTAGSSKNEPHLEKVRDARSV